MNQEIENAIREIKHLLSLNGIAPRTDHKSLLNVNLDKRKDALTTALKYLSLWGAWKCEHLAKDELASDCPMCHLAWCEARIQVLEAELTRLRGKLLKQESEIWCKHNQNMAGAYTRCLICKPIKPSENKLPEKMEVSNEDDVTYRVFAKEINKIIDYLDAHNKGGRGWQKR